MHWTTGTGCVCDGADWGKHSKRQQLEKQLLLVNSLTRVTNQTSRLVIPCPTCQLYQGLVRETLSPGRTRFTKEISPHNSGFLLPHFLTGGTHVRTHSVDGQERGAIPTTALVRGCVFLCGERQPAACDAAVATAACIHGNARAGAASGAASCAGGRSRARDDRASRDAAVPELLCARGDDALRQVPQAALPAVHQGSTRPQQPRRPSPLLREMCRGSAQPAGRGGLRLACVRCSGCGHLGCRDGLDHLNRRPLCAAAVTTFFVFSVKRKLMTQRNHAGF